MPEFALAWPFFSLAATIVLVGLASSHSSVRGTSDNPGFIAWLAHGGPLAALFHVVQKAERWLISKFAAAQLRLAAGWFSSWAVLWRLYFQSVGNVAQATSHAVTALDQAVPRIVRREVAPARRMAQAAHRAADRANAHARSVGTALEQYKARTNAKVHHLTHAVDVAIPRDIAGLRARNRALEDKQAKQGGAIKSLEDGAVDTWDWIRSHPLSAVTGVFAGAVAVALSRLGYGFLRCRSWQKLGRSLNCADGDLLSLLLGVITAVVGSVSLVSLAKEFVGLADEFVPVVTGFFTEFNQVTLRTAEQQGFARGNEHLPT